jgi:hypothetical protein
VFLVDPAASMQAVEKWKSAELLLKLETI